MPRRLHGARGDRQSLDRAIGSAIRGNTVGSGVVGPGKTGWLMVARIMMEMPHVRPVIDGRWHLTRLTRLPVPGEEIETLCGVRDVVTYAGRNAAEMIKQCWDCDLDYRKAHGLHIGPDHPATPTEP